MGERMNVMDATPLSMLQARLETNDKGVPYAHVANALAILAYDPNVAGSIGYNEFEEEPQFRRAPPALNPGDMPAAGPYPRAIRQSDLVAVTAYIQRAHIPRMGSGTVEEAAMAEAERNRFHPVREYLAGLEWDGAQRLDTWLCKAFGAADSPYVRACGAKMLIAAVRRVRQPGVKFDTMPVLEGGQGIGKSRSIRRLFGPAWFTDAMPADLKSKDGAQAVLGIWCIEFAEIEHLIRTDPETMKAFLSRPVERFRPPYGKGFLKRGRECVFIGTTNAVDYLRDGSGNRRIWPIACQHADEDWVAAHRDHLWAEAAAREAAGESIWLEEDAADEAAEAQADRIMEDVWAERMRTWMKDQRGLGLPHVTVARALTEGLGLTAAQMDKRAEMRAALILSREGLMRAVIRVNGRNTKVWRWPD
jgi:putative DNA primase/helicase